MLLRVSSVVAILCVSQVFCGAWFNYRLLRNPGLTNDTAGCHAECVSKCVSTPGCSGVSYRSSSGICLKSMCNSLDLVKNTGWNTYVIDTRYVEGVAYPAPRFEWMLTDTCGTKNLGPIPGPKMNLYNTTTYNSSFTLYAGSAAQYMNHNQSFARSDPDTALYNPFGSTSQTVMFWVNFYSQPPLNRSTLFEYSIDTSRRGILYWYHVANIWYDCNPSRNTTCSSNCGAGLYTWYPTLNAWHHITFVYNGLNGTYTAYLNMSFVGMRTTGVFINSLLWDTVSIAFSTFDPNGLLPGRAFCFKEFKAALTDDQIANAANSCVSSRIRLSN